MAPDYADAMFNLALLLQRKNQYRKLPSTGGAISPAIAVGMGYASSPIIEVL
jgi:hypothetical protein